jgi:hypothetical protein
LEIHTIINLKNVEGSGSGNILLEDKGTTKYHAGTKDCYNVISLVVNII